MGAYNHLILSDSCPSCGLLALPWPGTTPRFLIALFCAWAALSGLVCLGSALRHRDALPSWLPFGGQSISATAVNACSPPDSSESDCSRLPGGLGALDHALARHGLGQDVLDELEWDPSIDARTIGVQPWEKNMIPKVEKAIRDSDLGLNPQTDGKIIRVPIPPLTQSRMRRPDSAMRSFPT